MNLLSALVDCVGPLPKTKSGNKYVLTMMCAATRHPEAVPLRTIKTKAVTKALVKFFSTFVKVQILCLSPYHPESQGALQCFHQTLRRKFSLESTKDWDEGLSLLLLAMRETTQETLGFYFS